MPGEDRPQGSAEDQVAVLTMEGRPVEFTWRGRRYRIHSILSRWKEAGGWWHRPPLEQGQPDDGGAEVWRVEAAPVGALGMFHLTIDERTGTWRVGGE